MSCAAIALSLAASSWARIHAVTVATSLAEGCGSSSGGMLWSCSSVRTASQTCASDAETLPLILCSMSLAFCFLGPWQAMQCCLRNGAMVESKSSCARAAPVRMRIAKTRRFMKVMGLVLFGKSWLVFWLVHPRRDAPWEEHHRHKFRSNSFQQNYLSTGFSDSNLLRLLRFANHLPLTLPINRG